MMPLQKINCSRFKFILWKISSQIYVFDDTKHERRNRKLLQKLTMKFFSNKAKDLKLA